LTSGNLTPIFADCWSGSASKVRADIAPSITRVVEWHPLPARRGLLGKDDRHPNPGYIDCAKKSYIKKLPDCAKRLAY